MPALADRRKIHAAAMLHQTGVTPRSSGFKKFMQILARQNCIGNERPVALTVREGLRK
jgi:hypothetical protein